MAKNPLFNNRTSPNGATAPDNPLNDSYKRYKRGYNRFNLTRPNLTTERYADINPVEFVEGVEGDKLQFGIRHSIRTHTMASPIDFDLYKKMAYFLVDNKAILPNNWEKVYKQPNKGDDVAVDVNAVSQKFFSTIYRTQSSIRSGALDTNINSANYAWMFRYVLLLEMFFSNGSLLAKMNYHLAPMVRIRKLDNSEYDEQTFDEWFDQFFILLADFHPFYVVFPDISDKPFSTKVPPGDTSDNYIVRPLRTIVDMMRTFPNFNIVFNDEAIGYIGEEGAYNYVLSKIKQLHFVSFKEVPFNFSRFVAYQLVCTQFYTRDSVDYVYNAELWHENLESIITYGPLSIDTFTYNGVKCYYDVTSGHIFDKLLSAFFERTYSFDVSLRAYNYFHTLFGHRKSLRYGDYFTGAKTLPYAPGDVTADVVNSGVSALDVTRSILMQRFLNSVERVSNTWKDYLKGVTDGEAAPKDTEPRFLASTTSKVGSFEVENTSEAQGNIVTIMKSSNSNYIYEVECGSPCIIIGVSTYEVPRVYSGTTDKFFYHEDRFDMFNKFMQNIGDQSISMSERNASFSEATSFGYQPRHMEYKQRYPIASGGFVDFLPSYAFITDNRDSEQNELDFADSARHISPYYIRNRNSEFDRFYKSLTGVSLASYFHFQVKYMCICDATRQMEYSPTIL